MATPDPAPYRPGQIDRREGAGQIDRRGSVIKLMPRPPGKSERRGYPTRCQRQDCHRPRSIPCHRSCGAGSARLRQTCCANLLPACGRSRCSHRQPRPVQGRQRLRCDPYLGRSDYVDSLGSPCGKIDRQAYPVRHGTLCSLQQLLQRQRKQIQFLDLEDAQHRAVAMDTVLALVA